MPAARMHQRTLGWWNKLDAEEETVKFCTYKVHKVDKFTETE